MLSNVKRLPTSDDFNEPVTLDLNGEVVVRAKGDDKQPVTELALVNSTRSGDVIRMNTNRSLFARALALGDDLGVVQHGDRPVAQAGGRLESLGFDGPCVWDVIELEQFDERGAAAE